MANRRRIPGFASLIVLTLGCVFAAGDETNRPSAAEKPQPLVPNRPAVPGQLAVNLRTRGKDKTAKPTNRRTRWEVAETAIIICDMWDNHYCQSSAQRVDAMAPRMNRIITAARNHGVMIIHAPSSCMDKYADTPYRRRMQQAKAIKPPFTLQRWCYLEKDREGKLPIDDSKEPCDDPIVGPAVRKFTRQHKAIKIIGYDGVSDSGQEIYNMLRQLGIKNVAIMGVHTNKCVLGRPFGIRQLVKLGFNVALVRDLTDAMYDPREWPYVSHTRGTELVVEHIEQHWCPSITGQDLTRVVSGSNQPTGDSRTRP